MANDITTYAVGVQIEYRPSPRVDARAIGTQIEYRPSPRIDARAIGTQIEYRPSPRVDVYAIGTQIEYTTIRPPHVLTLAVGTQVEYHPVPVTEPDPPGPEPDLEPSPLTPAPTTIDEIGEAVRRLIAAPTATAEQVDAACAQVAALARTLAAYEVDPEGTGALRARRLVGLWHWRRNLRVKLLHFGLDVIDLKDRLGPPNGHVVVIHEGDTLQSIAHREWGDWELWPALLEANPGLTPANFAIGDRIFVPSTVAPTGAP